MNMSARGVEQVGVEQVGVIIHSYLNTTNLFVTGASCRWSTNYSNKINE